MRAPHLHDTLRRFCLGAFAVFTRELEDGVDLPFAFEEHGTYGRPTLYEYRPLVRGFVEARAERLFARVDVQDAVADLLREPAARIFAHAHEGDVRDEAPRGLPQRARAAPRAHRRGLRRLRLGRLRLRARVRGARGLALRRGPLVRRGRAADRALGRHADRARRRDPRARRRDRRARRRCGPRPRGCCRGTSAASRTGSACSSSSARWRAGRMKCPTRPASSRTRSRRSGSPRRRRLPRARSSSSGSTGGPYGIRPVLPIAATAPPGEPTRLDPFRASVASDVRVRLGVADDDAQLGDALDRWELALFQSEPFRGEQLRHALEAALGEGDGVWAAAMRGAALLGGDRGGARRPRREAARTDLRAAAPPARRRPPARRPTRARPRPRRGAARLRRRGCESPAARQLD